MDLTMAPEEKANRNRFHKKVEELRANNRPVMDCQRCLMIFTDPILYRMHIAMHDPNPSATWHCTMCQRTYSDRIEFHEHITKFQHSLIPKGIIVPEELPVRSGLPDLAAMCPPNRMLNEIVKKLDDGH